MFSRIANASLVGSCAVKPPVGISPGEVEFVVTASPGAGGGAIPPVGISPARAGTERVQARIAVITKRFIEVAPLRFLAMQNFLHRVRIEQHSQSSCKALGEPTTIPDVVASTLTLTLKGLSHMRITSPKLPTTHLSANEEALFRCQTALDLKDREDYEGAQGVMRPLWKGFGERPETKGLHPPVTAEVLLCVGILTGWVGNRNEVKEAQEQAKDFITESIALYESLGDVNKVAVARTELAYCYWREGALDEARITFKQALQRLTTQGNTRARALLRLAIVEWSAARYTESLRILEENSVLFKKIPNHALRGTYHNQLALVLRNLATERKKNDYIQRAIKEYEEADNEFKLARNIVFRAHVKNNVGFLLFKLSRFKEAYRWLEQARRLTLSVRDKVRTAQIDDTRAQVLIAQRKYKEAESVARGAVRAFEKSGQQCLFAEALITHGIALARLGKKEQAQFTFQRAVEVAHEVGALNRAGVAALCLIEELDDLSRDTLHSAFHSAAEWLANAEGEDLLARFCAAARRVFSALHGELTVEDATYRISNKPFDLHQEVLDFEETLIRHVLAKVNGRLTHAAALMGMSYQGLAYVIQSRHPALLKERSPVRRRARKKDMQGQGVSED